jgi:hypothetical protein
VTLSLHLSRTKPSPSRVETKCHRAFLPDTSGSIASPLMCFHKDQIVQIGTDTMLEACVSSGQIVALTSHQAGFTFGQVETDAAPSRALTQAKSGPYTASSGLHFWSNRDRRHAPGVRLLRPNRGLMPHQADFIFGQIGTDATLQACAYSGQIGALRRIKRTSSLVKSGPTLRSRRALTQAKSGPYAASSGLHLWSNRDRRYAPGVRLLRPSRGPTPHPTGFIFGHDDK